MVYLDWGRGSGKQSKRTLYLLHNDNFISRGLKRTNKKNPVPLRTVEGKTTPGYVFYTQSVIQGLTKSVFVFC
jgi:hypothetical protein